MYRLCYSLDRVVFHFQFVKLFLSLCVDFWSHIPSDFSEGKPKVRDLLSVVAWGGGLC